MKVEMRECRIDRHRSSRITEIYTHITNLAKTKIVSPLDNLDLKDNKKKEEK